jgi:hypothetical protein
MAERVKRSFGCRSAGRWRTQGQFSPLS